MTATSRHREAANTLLRDATRYTTFVDQAIRHIDQNLAGYPTAPSNNGTPNPMMDSDVHLTTTERGGTTRDPARADLEQMLDAVRKALPALQTAAAIAQRWACYQTDGATVQARLATIEASIWCTNCYRHGDHEPRAQGSTECAQCGTLRQALGRPAPRDLIELWRRRGRINDTDITNWKTRQNADAAERKRLQRMSKVSPKKTPA